MFFSFLFPSSLNLSQNIIVQWTQELERCEALKTLNMQSIISKLRNEIKQLWDDCHFGEKERSNFVYITSEDYDEVLLQAHEEEHQRLCDYKKERK